MLPERVDAAAAAALWAVHGSRAPATIDFARVAEIDSAGLALVLALRAPPTALLNVPDRFVQLCRAHRIEGLCT